MNSAPRPVPGAPDGAPLRGSSYPMRVGLVGAGRVGAVLGAALDAAGHHVVAASGVSDASRARIARLLPRAANLPADEVARCGARLLLVAVPDDALAGVVSGLAATGALRPGQIVAHTSGAHGLAVLDSAVARGAVPLALHPAMTFTGQVDDLDRLSGIAYGLTAPARLRPVAARLVTDLGGVPEWIAEPQRPLYHAALAHGANHLVTLVNEAGDLLREAGVGDPATVLGPLLTAALDNALRLGDAALTGPVSRGDAGTVARHLDRLAAVAPAAVPAYLALARRTADRAIATGRIRPRDAEELLDTLARVGEDERAGTGDGAGLAGRYGVTEVACTRKELAAARDDMPGTVAVVMTMGALHEGHRELLRAARRDADHVIATIFVNPLQFGPNEDFDRYPRTFDADLEVCRAERVDLVFAPSRAEMYPGGEPVVRVDPGPLGELLEGASRPGFFRGVLTVVLKLFLLTGADRAYFGEKDYQQLTLIRRMARDLEVPVEVVAVPTVRDSDGLALSSRNRYLSEAERGAALALSAALRAGAAAAAGGAGADGALTAAGAVVAASTAVKLDYLALTDPDLGPPPRVGPARLLVAARVGTTRLIDNVPVGLASGHATEEA